MEKTKVFADSSVLITAVLSSNGGSFYILTQFKEDFDFQISEYVLEETMRVLAQKFSSKPDLRNQLFLLISAAKINILPNPPPKELKPLRKVINAEDTPILASALKNDLCLLTLDNDFFKKSVTGFIQKNHFGFLILKPREFIMRYKNDLSGT